MITAYQPGETGMSEEWARDLADRCRRAGYSARVIETDKGWIIEVGDIVLTPGADDDAS